MPAPANVNPEVPPVKVKESPVRGPPESPVIEIELAGSM
jgi:hypothetical protein